MVRRYRKDFYFIRYIVDAFNFLDCILNTRLQCGARSLAAQNYRVALDGKVEKIKDAILGLRYDLGVNLPGKFQSRLLF
jgi:hypothetical protein